LRGCGIGFELTQGLCQRVLSLSGFPVAARSRDMYYEKRLLVHIGEDGGVASVIEVGDAGVSRPAAVLPAGGELAYAAAGAAALMLTLTVAIARARRR